MFKAVLASALLIWATLSPSGPVEAQKTDVAPGRQTLSALWEKGEQALAEGQTDEANAIFQEALALDHDNGRTWNYLGAVCFVQGEYYKALIRFKRAAEADPHDVKILNNLGTTYDKLGQYRQAVEFFQQAINADETYAEAYRNLGAVFRYGLKDNKSARQYWQKYLELADDGPDRGEIEAELAGMGSAE